ncbi:MAG: hypothetical protein HC876_22110 [Chloroflexaceae bacterium]|nr:hypothetical protein [Chloroflexaceae bacterium]
MHSDAFLMSAFQQVGQRVELFGGRQARALCARLNAVVVPGIAVPSHLRDDGIGIGSLDICNQFIHLFVIEKAGVR